MLSIKSLISFIDIDSKAGKRCSFNGVRRAGINATNIFDQPVFVYRSNLFQHSHRLFRKASFFEPYRYMSRKSLFLSLACDSSNGITGIQLWTRARYVYKSKVLPLRFLCRKHLIWSLSAENKKPPTDRVNPLRALFYLSAASHVCFSFHYSRSGIADRFL